MRENYIKKLVFIACCLVALGLNKASAQDSVRTGQWLSADVHYGSVAPFYPNTTSVLIQQHVAAFELDYVNKPEYRNNWLAAYHSPEIGLAAFYEYLGNPAQLGNVYGVYPFLNLHLKRSYKEGLYLRLGFGLCYLPVIFNRVENSQNLLIGSHLDALITVRLNYHFYLSDKARIEVGLGMAHSSNGELKTPNTGLNVITANTGFSYGIGTHSKFVAVPYTDTVKHKRYANEFLVATGVSEINPPGGIQYPEYTFSYMLYRRMNAKSKLGVGTDFFYNKANIARLQQEGVLLKNNMQNVQAGIKATYELTLGNLALPVEMGGYLYSKYTGNGRSYSRIGIRYYAAKHFFVNLSLLTHGAKPDFIEWGGGYTI